MCGRRRHSTRASSPRREWSALRRQDPYRNPTDATQPGGSADQQMVSSVTTCIRLGDPAGMVPQVSEDQRGVAAAVLHGLSSLDFVPALEGFLGTDSGLSAATITRLTVRWQDEATVFHQR